nr:PilZ domain-containing protein [uncultured Desulfobulbus sp.]
MPETITTARADAVSNRLHLTISGKIDIQALELLFVEVQKAVAQLQPGFEVVNDISQCKFIYVNSLPIYKKIIDFLLTQKTGEIIRIVQSDNISCKQIMSFSDQIHCYQPLYASSSHEAEELLKTVKPRQGIRLQLKHLQMAYDSAAGSGEAMLVDISTTGCAVTQAKPILPVGTQFEGYIAFSPHPPLLGRIQLKAKVVRTNNLGFAASFIDLSDDFREQLYQRLIHEACQSTFNMATQAST